MLLRISLPSRSNWLQHMFSFIDSILSLNNLLNGMLEFMGKTELFSMQKHVLAVFQRIHFLHLVFQSNVLKLVTG